MNSSWRETLFDKLIYIIYSYIDKQRNLVNQRLITNELISQLKTLTSSDDVYLNEVNFQQSNFQQTLYETNYNRLIAIKNKYHFTHMFYALIDVSNEYWIVAQDDKLCKNATWISELSILLNVLNVRER